MCFSRRLHQILIGGIAILGVAMFAITLQPASRELPRVTYSTIIIVEQSADSSPRTLVALCRTEDDRPADVSDELAPCTDRHTITSYLQPPDHSTPNTARSRKRITPSYSVSAVTGSFDSAQRCKR